MDYTKCGYVSSPKRRKNKKHMPKWKKTLVILGLSVVLLVAIAINYFISVAPMIVTLCEARIRAMTTSAISSAVFEVMVDSIKYSDLITIEKNSDNEVTLIKANSLLINTLARETAKKSEENLEKIGEYGVYIPIGTLTRTPLLAGYGPKIEIIVLPIGSVVCEFVSEFEEMGINQTRHKIFLNVLTSTNVIIPTANSVVKTTTQILISENIVIGKIPEVYLKSGNISEGDMLDLVPNR